MLKSVSLRNLVLLINVLCSVIGYGVDRECQSWQAGTDAEHDASKFSTAITTGTQLTTKTLQLGWTSAAGEKEIWSDIDEMTCEWMNERVQGKSLLLEVCGDSLELVDTHSRCVLTLQPIHLIRLWAVSRSDDRSALSLSLSLSLPLSCTLCRQNITLS